MVRRKSLGSLGCSVAKTLDVVGDPWTLLIVRDALVGVTRFDDFQRRLGIPRATLSARLDRLVADDILVRDDGYLLTERGRALRPVIVTLMQWGDEWARDDPPPTTFVDDVTGDPVDPVLVDRHSGRSLDEMRVRARGPVTDGITRRSSGAAL